MSHGMEYQPSSSTLRTRREALSKRLGDIPMILPSGSSVGRNYPGNPYPFRASSHFLYLTGQNIEDAWLEYQPTHGWTLRAPMPDPSDALWRGPRPSRDALEAATGCDVVYGKPKALAGAATVPATDATTRTRQQALLGRTLDRSGVDETLENALIAARSIHDASAQVALRAATTATVEAHRAGMAATRAGVSEYTICAAMEYALSKRGMGTAYSSIVTVHGEVLHNHHRGNLCNAGDLLLADVGAETPGGWAGDVTRTWPVNGTFSPTQRAIYAIVLSAQLDAIASVRPGTRYRDVHLKACRTLTRGLVDLGILSGSVDGLVERGVHALFFPHGVGHLLGLDVHDMEDLGDRAGYDEGRSRSKQFGLSFLRLDRDLHPGMAVTIEPGFYQVPAILNDAERIAIAGGDLHRERLRDFADVRGIRIEDDILVTTDGAEVMTSAAPKSVADVEASVGGSNGDILDAVLQGTCSRNDTSFG